MEIHPYSGTQYATTNAPQASAPAMPTKAIETMTSGMQAVNQHVQSFEDAVYDRVEYTVDQQNKLYLQQTQASIEATLKQALSAPDGSAGSLWNADGSFRNAEYNQLLANQLSRLNHMHNGYIRPKSREAAAAEVTSLKAKIKTGMDVRVAESIAPRAKSATLNLAQWQASQGLYSEAIATIQGAPEYALSPLEREKAIRTIAQDSIMTSAKGAVLTNDPAAYLSIVTNPETMNSMTPEQRDQLTAMQSQFADTDPPADRLPRSGKKSTEEKERKAANPLPLGVTDALIALHDQWLDDNGNYPKSGRARQEAINAFDTYAARYCHPNMTETDTLHLQNVAKSFGFTVEEANVFIQKHMAPFELTRGKFDFEKTLKELPDRYFFPSHTVTFLHSKQAEVSAAQSIITALPEGVPEEVSNQAQANLAAKQAELAMHEEALHNRIKDRRAEVHKRYSDWIMLQDPKKITDIDCRIMFYDIVDQVGDEEAGELADSNTNDFSRSFIYRSEHLKYEGVTKARNAGVQNRNKLDQETAQVDAARAEYEAAEQAKQASTLFSSASSFPVFMNDARNLPNTNEEAYIAVPNDSPLAGKDLALQYNGRTRLIPCRAADVAEPTLSMNARLKMGLVSANTAFTISHDKDGNAIMSAQQISPRENDMYDVMLSNEARVDANGRPMLYKLPAADGGGEYEVAGLNEKSNPAELAHVRQMIQEGRPTEEIRSYIKSVYKQKTNYAMQYLPPGYSQGVELFLRDCALNHSPKGVTTILCNAIGIPANTPNIQSEVAKFVRVHGEAALLHNLSIARGNYYAQLVGKKPGRSIFYKGWMNRNRTVYSASRSLLSTPSSNL